MNLLREAFTWITDPAQWIGPNSLLLLLGQHLMYTALAVAIAAVIAIPAGWAIGHTGRGREIAVAVSGLARAVPSFGLLILLVLLHKGRGGGLSDMFGGGVSSTASASGVAERNLNRLTVTLAVGWALCAVGLTVLERFL